MVQSAPPSPTDSFLPFSREVGGNFVGVARNFARCYLLSSMADGGGSLAICTLAAHKRRLAVLINQLLRFVLPKTSLPRCLGITWSNRMLDVSNPPCNIANLILPIRARNNSDEYDSDLSS